MLLKLSCENKVSCENKLSCENKVSRENKDICPGLYHSALYVMILAPICDCTADFIMLLTNAASHHNQ